MSLINWTLGLFAVLLSLATAAPLIHSNQWWIRLFDFPRLQLAALLVVALTGYAGLWSWGRLGQIDALVLMLAAVSLVWQCLLIVRYTPAYPTELAEKRGSGLDSQISLLISNVLYDNAEVEPLLRLIDQMQPDVVLLVEPTPRWQKDVARLERDYPYTILHAQENEYGILLYSGLELINPEVRFLIDDAIPSVRTKLRLRSSDVVSLYGLHPRPPGIKRPDGDGRRDSDQRDAELLLVAIEIAQRREEPTIVAGDFNDVAWSHTTRLFQRTSRLLDPRVGRGMYNTYDADSYVLRYPLDHVFASDHFRLAEIRRLPHIGSDHFPIYVTLECDPAGTADQPTPIPKVGDAS